MPAVRLYSARADGRLEDNQLEIDLAEFAGVCPAPGDRIMATPVDPDGSGGSVWEVTGRYFQPRGMGDYVALIVAERPLRREEIDLTAFRREVASVD